MTNPMDKADAISVLIDVTKSTNQPRKPLWNRMLRAFNTLGLSLDEQRRAARSLDVIQSDGRPWRAENSAPWPVGERT